uniref:Uncharacterized protein n=1 Tax=Eutreptiella gymnastica TaxID=73025 RepID=A0A7S4GDX0_9EUGL
MHAVRTQCKEIASIALLFFCTNRSSGHTLLLCATPCASQSLFGVFVCVSMCLRGMAAPEDLNTILFRLGAIERNMMASPLTLTQCIGSEGHTSPSAKKRGLQVDLGRRNPHTFRCHLPQKDRAFHVCRYWDPGLYELRLKPVLVHWLN